MSNTPAISTLATLANLPLSPERAQRLALQLAAVAHLMDEIRHLDLQHTSGTQYVIEETNIFRHDVVIPSLTQAQAIAHATQTHQGYIVVPPVLKSKTAS